MHFPPRSLPFSISERLPEVTQLVGGSQACVWPAQLLRHHYPGTKRPENKPSLCALLLCKPCRTSVSISEKWEEESLLGLPSGSEETGGKTAWVIQTRGLGPALLGQDLKSVCGESRPFGTRQTYRLTSGVRVALKSASLSCSERTMLCSLHSKKRDPGQSGGQATGQLALFASPLIVYNLHPYHLTRRLESVCNSQLCTETLKRGGDQTCTGESWEVGWGSSKITEPQR